MSRQSSNKKYGWRTNKRTHKHFPVHYNSNRQNRWSNRLSNNFLSATDVIIPIAATASCVIIPQTCLIDLLITHHQYVKTMIVEIYNYLETTPEDKSTQIKSNLYGDIGDIIDKNETNQISQKIGEKFSDYITENKYTDEVPKNLSLLIGTETSKQILSGLTSKAFNWASKVM